MAISPNIPIARVKDMTTYFDELFSTGPNGLPGFYDFLEMRGIPKSTFSQETYLNLAASSEMMYYSTYVQEAMKQMQAEQQETQYREHLATMPLEQLTAHAQQVRTQLEQAQTEGSPAVAFLTHQLTLIENEITKAGAQIAQEAS